MLKRHFKAYVTVIIQRTVDMILQDCNCTSGSAWKGTFSDLSGASQRILSKPNVVTFCFIREDSKLGPQTG